MFYLARFGVLLQSWDDGLAYTSLTYAVKCIWKHSEYTERVTDALNVRIFVYYSISCFNRSTKKRKKKRNVQYIHRYRVMSEVKLFWASCTVNQWNITI